MIKIWTWKPLNIQFHLAKDIESAVDYIHVHLEKYQSLLNAATDKWNEAIRVHNANTRSEIMKRMERNYVNISIEEIMDMFTVFNCDINSKILTHRKERHAISKSHN